MKADCLVLASLLAGVSVGCASQTHAVRTELSSPVTAGLIRYDADEGNQLFLDVGGKQFRAQGFKVEKHQNLGELRRRFGTEPKHWDRIFSGLDTRHVIKTANVALSTCDGTKLSCQFVWHGRNPEGTCSDGSGDRFKVVF